MAPRYDQLFLELLFGRSLYDQIDLSDDEAGQFMNYLYTTQHRFDGYCIECEDRTIFVDYRVQALRQERMDPNADVEFSMSFSCTRNLNHKVFFVLKVRDKNLFKIGQYPSHADLSNPELKKYRKILGRDRASELHKAIGLASHGVGIGSYAYLRRIFESLLTDHRRDHEEASGKIDGYERMRVDARIEALEDVLPPALVRNRRIYGVMSKGIHELTEEQCLALFPILRDGIVLILEQDRESRERREREERLQQDLAKAGSLFDELKEID